MKMTMTRKIMLGLLIALLCVTLIATASITFSGYASVSGDDGIAAIADNDVTCNHEWTHSDATQLTTAGGNIVSSLGHYYLEGDVTLASNIIISGNVEICLNGHSIRGTGTGSVVTVSNDATFVLYDCSGSGNGSISGGNNVTNGGGVYVSYGTFIMNGGKVSGNSATNFGGGVYVDGGLLVMNAGTVESNSAYMGAGIYVNYGSLDTDGVKMTAAVEDVIYARGVFTMSNGLITGNIASEHGGGVYSSSDCTFTMTGGEISGNTAASNGGGVFTDIRGTFTMSNGLITANTATLGSGVYVWGSREETNGKFVLSGSPVIYENEKGNLYLANGAIITISGRFDDSALIGVSCLDENEIFTSGWSKYNAETPLKYFYSDFKGKSIIEEGGEASYITGHKHGDTVFMLLNEVKPLASGIYYIEGDLRGNLVITGNVELCLNGCSIVASSGTVIKVESGAKFTLHDCSYDDSGHVTGGDASEGAGVRVDGEFIMNGGTITGNEAKYPSGDILGGTAYGGGVFVGGKFTMNGGKIVGNDAEFYGGGVFIEGGKSFTMNGGTISNNTSGWNGDGVCVYGGTFTMTGGIITNNEEGVFVYNNPSISSSVFVSGSPVVTGNTRVNMYLYRDNAYQYPEQPGGLDTSLAISVAGKLESDAHIDIVITGGNGVIATGWNDSYGHPGQFFFPETDGKCVGAHNGRVTIEQHGYTLKGSVSEHHMECDNCADIIDEFTHQWNEVTNYVSDNGATHQRVCPVCEVKQGVSESHVVTKAEIRGSRHIGNCDFCSAEVTDNHSTANHYVAPTCEDDGEDTDYCPICSATLQSKILNALGHTSDGGKVTKDATCTEDGAITHTCETCKKVLKSETITKLGHKSDGGKITKVVTCEEDGVFTDTCTVCGDVIEAKAITALGHTMDEGTVTTAATCIETGIMTYACVNGCGKIFKEDVIAKTDHDWDEGAVTKEPTLEFDGVYTYTCKYCHKTTRKNIPALKDVPADNPGEEPGEKGLSKELREKIFWSAMLLLIVIVSTVTSIIVVRKKLK